MFFYNIEILGKVMTVEYILAPECLLLLSFLCNDIVSIDVSSLLFILLVFSVCVWLGVGSLFRHIAMKIRKRAKKRNEYDQAPHLTQDTNGKVTTSK